MYFTYILKSEKTGRHYYGSTKDLSKRLIAHNRGKVKSTKGQVLWNILYKEMYHTRSEAFRREQHFKSVDGYKELKELGII